MLKVSSKYHLKGCPAFRPDRFTQAAVYSSKNKPIIKPQAVCILQFIYFSIISIKHNSGFITVISFMSPHGVFKLSTVTLSDGISVSSSINCQITYSMCSNGSSDSDANWQIMPVDPGSILDTVLFKRNDPKRQCPHV